MEASIMLRDGHIHTSYCPHGTRDTLKKYVETALDIGYKEMSFTEHAPLPEGFIDPTPTKDSAMSLEQMEGYITSIKEVKEEYHKDITIHIGLEVDFIEGFEQETENFLNDYGKYLSDSILSVHFLKTEEEYICLDYSKDAFQKLVNNLGSIENVYDRYVDTVRKSINTELGNFKPRRIGHISLVRKFHKEFPSPAQFEEDLKGLLKDIKKARYSLDVNSAGLRKPYCEEPYPPLSIIEHANKLGIPLVYGSDAHKAEDLGKGLPLLQKYINF